MIKVYLNHQMVRQFYEIDESTIIFFNQMNSIRSYSVDFNKEIIKVSYDDSSKEKKNYGKHKDNVNQYLHTILADFQFHKKDETKLGHYVDDKINPYLDCMIDPRRINPCRVVSASFLDELHFIGVMYVNNIMTLTAKEMPKQDAQSLFEKIKEECKGLKERSFGNCLSTIPSDDFVEEERRDSLRALLRMDEKAIYSRLTAAQELLACFDKKTKTISICEENIKVFCEMVNGKGFEVYPTDLNQCINLILLHEFGHSVFQYTEDKYHPTPILDETRANYFASPDI